MPGLGAEGKIEFLLLPEHGEQSEKKHERIPLFFPLLA